MVMTHYNRGRRIYENAFQRNVDKLGISFHTTENVLITICLSTLESKLKNKKIKTSLISPASYSGKFDCLYSKWMITQRAAPH